MSRMDRRRSRAPAVGCDSCVAGDLPPVVVSPRRRVAHAFWFTVAFLAAFAVVTLAHATRCEAQETPIVADTTALLIGVNNYLPDSVRVMVSLPGGSWWVIGTIAPGEGGFLVVGSAALRDSPVVALSWSLVGHHGQSTPEVVMRNIGRPTARHLMTGRPPFTPEA